MAEIDGNVSEMRRILLFLYQLFQMFHLSHLSRLSRMQQVCSFSRAVALFFLFLRNPLDKYSVVGYILSNRLLKLSTPM